MRQQYAEDEVKSCTGSIWRDLRNASNDFTEIAFGSPKSSSSRWCSAKPFMGNEVVTASRRCRPRCYLVIKECRRIEAGLKERWGGCVSSGSLRFFVRGVAVPKGHIQPFFETDDEDVACAGVREERRHSSFAL